MCHQVSRSRPYRCRHAKLGYASVQTRHKSASVPWQGCTTHFYTKLVYAINAFYWICKIRTPLEMLFIYLFYVCMLTPSDQKWLRSYCSKFINFSIDLSSSVLSGFFCLTFLRIHCLISGLLAHPTDPALHVCPSTTEFFVFQQSFYLTRRFDPETWAFFQKTSCSIKWLLEDEEFCCWM